MLKKIIILDRDGVINLDTHYPHKIKEIIFMPYIFDVCKYLTNKGYELAVITNQSGIGRGIFSNNEYLKVRDWIISKFEEHNIKFLEFLHCPHRPEINCECRKPNTALYEILKKKYPIDLSNSWAIGDRDTDVIAANKAGIKNTIFIGNQKELKVSIDSNIVKSLEEIKNIIH